MTSKWDDGLEDPHLQIAKSSSSRIAILAGPGTGKTKFGLLRRIMRLIQKDNVPAENILFLTFTRTAAEDFVLALDKAEVEGYSDLDASTVHSFCLKLIKSEQFIEIMGRQVNHILLKYEEDVMLLDLPDDFGTLSEKRKMLLDFANGWARGVTEYPGKPTNKLQEAFQNNILSWLKDHQAMLIGEVVPLAYSFLSANPDNDLLSRYTHIIVDEYQDLNRTEQQLLELLCGEKGSICIAGDDDQSIYGFRCANPDGISEFFNSANEQIKIETCRRCPKPILLLANKIKEKFINTTKGPMNCYDDTQPGSISLIQWEDNEDEAEGIANAIKADIDEGRQNPGDFLVLVQSKILGKNIRNKINDADIECHSFFQDDPINGSESKKAFTLLQLLANPNDKVALRYWLGYNDASARKISYSKLREIADDNNKSVKVILASALTDKSITGISSLTKRYEEFVNIQSNMSDKSLDVIVNNIFPEGIEDLDDLRRIALTVLKESENLESLLPKMLHVITQTGVPENPNFVRVMSLHKSKGLTSKVVYIAGIVQGLIPKQAADREEDQESRRLFYVGVTRAKNDLVLSSFTSAPYLSIKKLKIPQGKYIKTKNGEKYFRTLASEYISEILPVTPTPIKGKEWLSSKM